MVKEGGQKVSPPPTRRGTNGPLAVLPIDLALKLGLGLDQLRRMGAEGCVVLGDPRYYGRFAFTNDPELRYGDVPPERYGDVPPESTSNSCCSKV